MGVQILLLTVLGGGSCVFLWLVSLFYEPRVGQECPVVAVI